MQTKLDEAKAELLARAARVAENSPAGGPGALGDTPRSDRAATTEATSEEGPDQGVLLGYLQRYYLHTAPEDLADRDPVDVFGAALSHYRLAENRPQGTANVRVHTPTRRGERLDAAATPSSRWSPTTCPSWSTRSPTSCPGRAAASTW